MVPEKGGGALKGRGTRGFPEGEGNWKVENRGGLEKSLEGDLGPGGQKWSQRARDQPRGLGKLPRAHGQGYSSSPIPGTSQEPPHSSCADDPQVLGLRSGDESPCRAERREQREDGSVGEQRGPRRAEEPPEGRYPGPWPQKFPGAKCSGYPGGVPTGSSSPLRVPSLPVEQARCSGCPRHPNHSQQPQTSSPPLAALHSSSWSERETPPGFLQPLGIPPPPSQQACCSPPKGSQTAPSVPKWHLNPNCSLPSTSVLPGSEKKVHPSLSQPSRHTAPGF